MPKRNGRSVIQGVVCDRREAVRARRCVRIQACQRGEARKRVETAVAFLPVVREAALWVAERVVRDREPRGRFE